MFDFLFGSNKKENNESNKQPNILASITYYIADNLDPTIDISLGDYNDKSVNALCSLLDILSKDACYLETLEMVKNGLIKDQKEEILIKIFTHISEQAGKKIHRVQKESLQDQPCIKPSDMLK